MGEELWPSPGEQARLLALSDAPISAYYVKGCGEGCMRGCVIRYFPPTAGAAPAAEAAPAAAAAHGTGAH